MDMENTEFTFFDRDLSWLRFNHRVLQEAKDKRNPLYERIKFIAIYSSNLDEFFKVRVSDIRQIKNLKKNLRKKLVTRPNKLLKEIKAQVDIQGDELGEIYRNEIIPELLENGIALVDYNSFGEELKKFSVAYYIENLAEKSSVKKNLKSEEERLLIENEEIYLISFNESDGLVCASLPENHSRFVVLPKDDDLYKIAFVDDIMKHYLESQFGSRFYTIKVSRDAELYIEDEYSGNLLEKIASSLSNRDVGQVTRALVERNIPDELLKHFAEFLDINETDIVRGGEYHNLKDLFSFPNPSTKNLSMEELAPKRNGDLSSYQSMLAAINDKDRLLYYPYESFEDVVRLVEEAAEDPLVEQIKMTLYRVSNDSRIAKALLSAVQNGKEVFTFIETKARFDEANNIKWGKKLKEAGAHVMFSYPGIKVHSKILYIARRESEDLKAYAYIGSGNFNEKTAKIYTDFGLMTKSKKITRDLLQVFQVLEGKLIIPKAKRLLVSPFNSRKKFISMINQEIRNAQSGTDAYIILKMNSLQDKEMIQKLYEASNAGVKIQVIVRGICCLISGIKNQSENIEVISIVDRFLEHARIFVFCNSGEEVMFMGSADWMTRNLDHRIEVVTPILDEDNYHKMRKALQLQLEDKVKARIIDEMQSNSYKDANNTSESSQVNTYHNLV